jgi:very-short-patch-repair endonuclease
VGYAKLTFEGRSIAAVLAIGGSAAVSHRSAAAIWGILPAHDGAIEVTVPGNGGREKRGGIRVHRSHSLIAAVTTRRNGIALTKPARTLQDLHRVASTDLYRRAVRRALDLRLVTSADLRNEDDLTRSELERLFLSLCRRHRLPQPEVNARIGSCEVDFLWRDRRLVVETDGFRHHSNRAAFESDRARDAHLQSRGYRVLRFTYRQVSESPRTIVESLRELLAQPTLA